MRNRLIERWMLLLLVMLLTACHSDDKEEIVIPEDEDCYLDIYVYAPDRPIVTRADVGEISSSELESKVHTLQIWVFKNSNGEKVGYLDADPQNLNNEIGQQKYRMMISNDFARYPENVDVYVVANAASCGLSSLGASTTRNDLNEAMIGTGYFGTSDLYGKDDLLTTGRIVTYGLPMSAVLKNQPISGKFPTLRIGTESQIATLHLTRAVSKLRFVLCRIKETKSTSKTFVSIDDIQLTDGDQTSPSTLIPSQTYLMPGTYSYTNYVSGSIDYVEDPLTIIPVVKDPLAYTYETLSAQEYENLINDAISGVRKANDGDENLKELGLTYLRESDKQLKGIIKYQYRENGELKPQATATFLMAAPGDFLRNHSWIIYIYYLDSKIYTLTVTNIGMRQWETDPLVENKEVYNW